MDENRFARQSPFVGASQERIEGLIAGYETYPLHFLDNHHGFKDTYTYTLQFNDVLDADELHRALCRLLNHGDWRKFGGRLRVVKAKGRERLEIHVPVTFGPQHETVAYSHQVYRSKLREHPLANLLPKSTGVQGSIQEGADYFRELSASPETPKNFSEYLKGDIPILALHVICFSDATLVSIAWPHVIMDGCGLQALLQAWSHMLAGRDSSVPAVLGVQEDILAKACESREHPREEYVLEGKLLKGFGLFLLLAYTVWDRIYGFFGKSKKVNRTVYLPRGVVQKLRDQAVVEICRAKNGKDDKVWLSECDVILAWFIRTAALCEPKPRPITVFAAFDFRSRLPDFILKSGVYIQNMAWLTTTPLDIKTVTGPLGQIAIAYRKSLTDQTGQGQVLSLLRKLKHQWDSGSHMALFSGPPNALFYPAGNLVKLDFLRAASFGPAVFKQGDESPSRKNPLGTCVYHHKGFWNEDRVLKQGMFILGKDWDDNYWITGYGTDDFWRRIQGDMDEMTTRR